VTPPARLNISTCTGGKSRTWRRSFSLATESRSTVPDEPALGRGEAEAAYPFGEYRPRNAGARCRRVFGSIRRRVSEDGQVMGLATDRRRTENISRRLAWSILTFRQCGKVEGVGFAIEEPFAADAGRADVPHARAFASAVPSAW
jgi:hypothetical protein